MNIKSMKTIAGIIVGFGLLYGFFELQASLTKPEIHWLKQPYQAPQLGIVDKKHPQKLQDVAGKVLMMESTDG